MWGVLPCSASECVGELSNSGQTQGSSCSCLWKAVLICNSFISNIHLKSSLCQTFCLISNWFTLGCGKTTNIINWASSKILTITLNKLFTFLGVRSFASHGTKQSVEKFKAKKKREKLINFSTHCQIKMAILFFIT